MNNQVAQSQTFSLGDNDNSEAIWALFRHMYNFEYSFDKDLHSENAPGYHIDVYEIADKYDCPSLRAKAVQNFINCIKPVVYKSDIGKTVPIISRIFGPVASHPGNSEIRILMTQFIYYYSTELTKDIAFIEALAVGDLFDATSANNFLAIVLSDISHLRANAHFKETGQDLRESPADRSIRKMARDLGGDENPFAD